MLKCYYRHFLMIAYINKKKLSCDCNFSVFFVFLYIWIFVFLYLDWPSPHCLPITPALPIIRQWDQNYRLAYSTLYMCQNRPAFGGSTIAGRSLFLLWLELFSGATVRLGLIWWSSHQDNILGFGNIKPPLASLTNL